MEGLKFVAIFCVLGLSVCDEVCHTESGDKQIGDTWEEDCQMCRCRSSEGAASADCQRPLCFPLERACIKWDDSGCCPVCVEKGCKHGNKTYPIGYEERPEPCTTCICHEWGSYQCSTLACMVAGPECRLSPEGESVCCEMKKIEGTCCGYEQICPPGTHLKK
ncbi:von Willebrand factor C domain-containing protein 2-like [Gigantopelta aegis]|uniref:von Willebrand factor C domain-containing protein 2-like n=1 Tax=Gigantopelta aegis TaxID=1735272 RepID=UPI001B88B103|nr:von Willebrand factor C domain-containing protein 2-like [Gigantopelta aegis]